MPDKQLNTLKSRIEKLVSDHKADLDIKKQKVQEEMKEWGHREERFQEVASRLFTEIIEPRLELMESYFDDSAYQSSKKGWIGRVKFNKDRRYNNATVELEFEIQFDQMGEKVLVIYRFKLMPILMQYQPEEMCPLFLDAPDKKKLATFVEEKISQSIETYLKFQENPNYQKENMVTDPVCGMAINRLEATASQEYEKKLYYFCTNACKEKFSLNPEEF